MYSFLVVMSVVYAGVSLIQLLRLIWRANTEGISNPNKPATELQLPGAAAGDAVGINEEEVDVSLSVLMMSNTSNSEGEGENQIKNNFRVFGFHFGGLAVAVTTVTYLCYELYPFSLRANITQNCIL
eukprot:TRINITY_DN5098_c0_g1_i2.p2 TRINITY_DN5098_c0_g1~~TRINITY_DN5098_c0_g1_i2.p2  ORF type:complete len:127 (-),score=26.19 TRINITY_DN5098_c0_g1_i2:262-642(-)